MGSYLLPRPFPYNARRFRTVFRLHLVGVIALAFLAFVVIKVSPKLLFVAYIIIMCMAAVIGLTFINALPPVRTTHSVDGDSVVLRQGLGFRLNIPLEKISKAKLVGGRSGRPGIFPDRVNSTLEVLASNGEAVRLKLNQPVRYRGVPVDVIIVDVLEPREFIGCIRDRKKGAALMARLDGQRKKKTAEPPEVPGEAPGKPEREESSDDLEPEEPPKPGPEVEEEIRIPVAAKVKKAPPPEEVDEIELVPALPGMGAAPARVVRIPKRKP